MTTGTSQSNALAQLRRFLSRWKTDVLAIFVLVLMAAYFLGASWRKWPDPITDSGLQWYGFWRLSQGAMLYHDVLWNYGPLSAYFDAALFRCFGTGMMVLVMANLVIYGLILSLAYAAFRKAWGRLGAFVALAVFISVFSFSHLCAVANYNFATPYAQESTHGFLLVLVTALIAVRWCVRPSAPFAFLLGLCGGLSVVLKPEFMLAGGVLGMAACVMRHVQRQNVRFSEILLVLAGVALPTVAFTVWFARTEPWKYAFIDSSQAWWTVLVNRTQVDAGSQQTFMGFDHPWLYGFKELRAALFAVIALGAIWAAGWCVNRPWSGLIRLVTVLGAAALACSINLEGGWFQVGRCFPGLVAVTLILVILRLRRELRETGRANEGTLMAFALVLLAGAMLARMPLRSRVYHLGFFQAALAGMVVAAFIVANVPLWVGSGAWGSRLATAGCGLALAIGCASIAAKSHEIRAEQTESVGAGRDHFYAFNDEVDQTGSLVNWTVERLKSAPPDGTLYVAPEGAMINYLSRRVSPMTASSDEKQLLARLQQAPPDFVVFISRNLGEFGINRYGAPGGPGYLVVKWVSENYLIDSARGADPFGPGGGKGAIILHRKTSSQPGSVSLGQASRAAEIRR